MVTPSRGQTLVHGIFEASREVEGQLFAFSQGHMLWFLLLEAFLKVNTLPEFTYIKLVYKQAKHHCCQSLIILWVFMIVGFLFYAALTGSGLGEKKIAYFFVARILSARIKFTQNKCSGYSHLESCEQLMPILLMLFINS